MSLLLDALKKAADDKQKSSVGEPLPEQTEGVESKEKMAVKGSSNSDSESALTLEEPELTLEPDSTNDVLTEDMTQSVPDENTVETNSEKAENFTVSDDALSMLIYKTNRDVKKNKKILLISIIIIILIILVSGGMFYYADTQEEIASLERKHKIAMQSMHSKTSDSVMPRNADVVRHLDKNIESVLNKKQPQKAVLNKKVTTKQEKTQPKNNLSIQKTNKSDPVGEKLDYAWLAYEQGSYQQATKLYQDALSLEKNNRDALLGLGAIAVLEKNNLRAREIYHALLEQDPRDPIATAAIASLRSDEASLKADEKYLLSMLNKNPEAPHLNFSLGNIYAKQKKWVSAQQYYFNAWQQDSENADYIFNLAVSMDQLNKKSQAINFYKNSLAKAKNKQVSFSRDAVKKRISDLSE